MMIKMIGKSTRNLVLIKDKLILDKAGASALYFMADIATQLSIVASAQINGIPNNVEAELRGAATPENIINKVIRI
jgi:hypothetical protein